MKTQSRQKTNRLIHAQRPGILEHYLACNGHPPQDQAGGHFLKNQTMLCKFLCALRTSYIVCSVLFVYTNTGQAEICYVKSATTSSISDQKLADAIFKAEGGFKTAYPYGIRSVKCAGLSECRKVCLNTIRNNRTRWTKAGNPGTYLEFLASRYAPIQAHSLNRYWLGNVQKFMGGVK